MAAAPTPSSPHLYPLRNASRSISQNGRADEAIIRTANGAKKLVDAWTRPRATTPDPATTLGTLARSRSQLDMSSLAANGTSYSMAEPTSYRSASRVSRHVDELQRQPNLARNLINKSSRFLQKRKSTPKLRSAPTTSVWEDDDAPFAIPSFLLPKSITSQPAPPPLRKESISEPFNFQHITHTNLSDAKNLQSARGSSLATEFCALRASQKPRRGLKGIKVDDLAAGANARSASMLSSGNAGTMLRSPENSRPTSPGQERSLKTSQSVDNFRLVTSGSYSTPYGLVNPPPRKSSRKPITLAKVLIDTAAPAAPDSPTLPTPATVSTARSLNSPWSATAVSTPATEMSQRSPIEIAQAMTTPDDTAYEMQSQSKESSSVVSTNPCEAEASETDRSPGRSSTSSLRHSKSLPTVKHFSRIWASGTSLTATDPTLPSPDRSPERLPAHPRRASMIPKVLQESWEESVDYCYDYAMDDMGFDEGLVMGATSYEGKPTGAVTPAMTDSVNSSALSFHGAATPSQPMPSPGLMDGSPDSNGASFFPLGSSFVAHKDYYSSRAMHEEHYNRELNDVGPRGARYSTFYYPHMDAAEVALPRSGSPPSSNAPLSKSSSQVSFASHRHQESTSSAGGRSTPALVRGKLSSREQLAGYTGAADIGGVLGSSTITHAIDSMRRDLIRAAEEMPDEQFDATISPTLTPPPSRLTFRTACPSPENGEPEFAAKHPAALLRHGDAKPQHSQPRQRASSAAQAPAKRVLGHRTSYSLFPAPVRSQLT